VQPDLLRRLEGALGGHHAREALRTFLVGSRCTLAVRRRRRRRRGCHRHRRARMPARPHAHTPTPAGVVTSAGVANERPPGFARVKEVHPGLETRRRCATIPWKWQWHTHLPGSWRDPPPPLSSSRSTRRHPPHSHRPRHPSSPRRRRTRSGGRHWAAAVVAGCYRRSLVAWLPGHAGRL
jgi:hypothetical protein